MPDIVIFNSSNRVTDYRKSISAPDYDGRTDVLFNPDLSGVLGVEMKYWKHSSGQVIEMTQIEKDVYDEEQRILVRDSTRTESDITLGAMKIEGMLLRAIAGVLVDEINILRSKHALSDRTLAQAKQAIKDKITNGAAD